MSSFTINPVTIAMIGGVFNIPFSLAGVSTTWTGAPFTISGGSGASIVSQTVTNNTTATIVINPGTAFGMLTISDGTNTAQILAIDEELFTDYDWTTGLYGSTSYGGANTNTGTGFYIDIEGNEVKLVTSPSAQLQVKGSSFYVHNGVIVLPSLYQTLDNQVHIIGPASNTACWAVLRWTGSNNMYLVGCGSTGGASQMYACVGGTLHSLKLLSYTAPASTDIIHTIAGTYINNGGLTVLYVQIINLTTGALVATFAAIDTSSLGPQTVGQCGFAASATALINRAFCTNGTLTPIDGNGTTTAVTNAPVTVTLTGIGTAWTSSMPTFSITGGTYTSLSQSIISDTSATVTFTPTQNNQYIITDPAGNGTAYVDALGAASGYSAGLSAPHNFTGVPVTLNFALTGGTTVSPNLVITPAVSGVSGVFSPTTITLSNGSITGSCTFTPSTIGTATFSFTHTGGNVGMTDPANLTYYSDPPTINIPVNDPSIVYSPGNWAGDTNGRFGSALRYSWNAGAYFRFYWTTTSGFPTLTLNFDIAHYSVTTNAAAVTVFPTIMVLLDGAIINTYTVSGTTVSIPIPAAGTHELDVYIQTISPNFDRWGSNGVYPNNSLMLTGITVDGYTTTIPTNPANNWALIVGDSITEGYFAGVGAVNNQNFDYSFSVGQQLLAKGYEYCISACGGNAMLFSGTGLVAAYYYINGSGYGNLSRWNKINGVGSVPAVGNTLLDTNGLFSAYGNTGTPPSIIMINLGTNEALASSNTSWLNTSFIDCLTSWRTAAPNAIFMVIVPFGLQYAAKWNQVYAQTIISAVQSYIASTKDNKVFICNLGANFAAMVSTGPYINSDGVHPLTSGHVLCAGGVMSSLQNALDQTGGVEMSGVEVG